MVENGSFETVSIGDYVGVVWRRKWIVILVTLLITGASVLFAKHQQTLYASTATVVYNPNGANALQQSAKASTSGNWGTDNVDLATSLPFAQWALSHHHPPQKALLANAQTLLANSSVAPTTSGNGITFTATEPTASAAIATANELATSYPGYLQSTTLPSNIKKMESTYAAMAIKLSNPPLYGPYLKNSDGTFALDANGHTQVDKQALKTEKIQYQILGYSITQAKDSQPPATTATSTTINHTSAATKTQPQTTRTALIGLFIGLVVGIVLAFLQDVLDTRIRSAEDVGRRIRLPLLARIPTTPRSVGKQLAMLVEPDKTLVPTFEAYRIAKLNLTGAIDRTRARAIMFTAPGEDEGTSQTVANLAVVLARSGKHVILVDANLRTPAQAEFFGLDDRLGLCDVLLGHAKLADALTAVDVSRDRAANQPTANGRAQADGILEVLPAGSLPADPAELLDTRVAAELIAALSQRADVVLVDAPAILPVTDAMVLASKVDGVVVVSNYRRANRPNATALRRALDNCPAPGIGFVFTGDRSGARNDYGGSYTSARPSAGAYEEERDPREVGVL